MLPNLDPYAPTPEQGSFQLMLSVAESLLSDIFRLGNSPVTDETLGSLRGIHAKALDFSESIVAKGATLESLSDFENALEELADAITKLDAACDAFDLADDEASMEDVLESAGEALLDLAGAIQEVDQLAEYIETTEQLVQSKWGDKLATIANLPDKQAKETIDLLLDQARTRKESAFLLMLAKGILVQRG